MNHLKTVVVSGCNHTYFHYLRDLVTSFVACGAAQKYDFAVIDCGLEKEQLEWLRESGVHLHHQSRMADQRA